MKKLFDSFWKEYPRKVGKKQSLDAWLRLKPSPELCAEIMKALTKQKLYKKMCDDNSMWHPDFPHPVRWIKYERWEDEVPNILETLNNHLKSNSQVYINPNKNGRDER